MQYVMHFAPNALYTTQNDSQTMQNDGRTTRNVGHNTYLKKLWCLEIIFRTLGTKKNKK